MLRGRVRSGRAPRVAFSWPVLAWLAIWAAPARGDDPASAALPEVPEARADAAWAPSGYRVEVVVAGLDFPSSVETDDAGNVYVAESGYDGTLRAVAPRILRIARDGRVAVLVAQGLVAPLNDLLWHAGRLYVSHRGKVSVVEDAGRLTDVVVGLPSLGDHHNNQLAAGPDGKLYLGQGTATNSGVVGEDNALLGWLPKHPEVRDVPARDVKLVGQAFESRDARLPEAAAKGKTVRTSAFSAFGATVAPGAVVPGSAKANGTILRFGPDGKDLEVFAWGLRNPYGLAFGPEGRLFATENGLDGRGSRPVANDLEDLYEIRQGAFYGWPDFASGVPLTDPRFAPADGRPPQFLLAEHPKVEKPLLTFPSHSAVTKLDASPGGAFGHGGQLFLAFFGHMTPLTGRDEPKEHGEHAVLRVDLAGPRAEPFFRNREDVEHALGREQVSHGAHGADGGSRAHRTRDSEEGATPGPRRLMDVRFAAGGEAMYVVDFGAMFLREKPHAVPGTGVLWRVVPRSVESVAPRAGLTAPD